jgi:hypothetical protein
VFFNTPLGRAGRFRPAPPDLPARLRSRRNFSVRDTLPLCLGSNCSLVKEHAGLNALFRDARLYRPGWACQSPASENLRSLVSVPVAWTAAETGLKACQPRLTSFSSIPHPLNPVKMILARISPKLEPRVTTCSYSAYERPNLWETPGPLALFLPSRYLAAGNRADSSSPGEAGRHTLGPCHISCVLAVCTCRAGP